MPSQLTKQLQLKHNSKKQRIMKILVLNCGSSSIKYKLFDMTTKEVMAQGGIEKIGLPGSFLKFTLPNGDKKILEKDIPEHTAGIEFILNTLVSEEYGAIKSLEEIKNNAFKSLKENLFKK